MKATSIYQFSTMVPYLQASGLHDAARPGSSLAVLARRLGYRSRRGVAMVFSGERLPSAQMAQRLSRALAHSERERCYFGLLIEKERLARRGLRTAPLDQELDDLRPTLPAQQLLTDADFTKISAWYFLPLKQLVEGPGFREDPQWISRRLRRKVTAGQVASALRTMEALGMLGRDAARRLVVRDKAVLAGQDVPSDAVRAHHRQMLHRAAEALTEQGVAEREFGSMTLAIDAAEMPAAKACLREFFVNFAKRFHADDQRDIYQLSMQFFAHTAAVRAVAPPVAPNAPGTAAQRT